jgi:hypothetical protein
MINDIIYKISKPDSKLHRWSTFKGNTPFAPVLDVPIWVDDLDETLISKVLKTAVEKEKDFKNLHWTQYNIFTWNEVEISVLKKEILRIHNEFLTNLGLPLRNDLWINGWIYPQKKGMSLKPHNHAVHENCYLSANIVLTQNKTTTDFDIPYLSINAGLFELENRLGRMTLFPSYLVHSVKELQDEERYTIGLDIITQQGMETFWKYSNNPNDPLHRAIKLC